MDPEDEIGSALRNSKRFVLDEAMSAYLADLSLAPLCSRAPERRCEIIEEMRKLARLPFKTTWIEMDLYSFSRRAYEEYKSCDFAHDVVPFDENTPGSIGWLIRRHPKSNTSFTALAFTSGPERIISCLKPGSIELLLPEFIGFAWSADETQMPWQEYRYHTRHSGGSSEALTGIRGYKTPHLIAVSTPYSHLLETGDDADHFCTMIGDARKLWALLAHSTIFR